MIFDGKRSEMEILSEMLNATQNGIKKTQLMFHTKLSYNHFTDYLDFLLEKKFVELNEDNSKGKIYRSTEEGNSFLNEINSVLEYIK